MTSIENVFEQLEEQGLVFKSANNLLHISIDASDYLDIKRFSKEMHKKEIIASYKADSFHVALKDAEDYYQETFVSKGSDDHISDISKMVEDDVEKLAEEEYPIFDGDLLGIAHNQKQSRIDFIKGYNKAKETLYTEEQVREVAKYTISEWASLNEQREHDHEKLVKTWLSIELQNFIQSLKQPKQ